MRKRKCNFFSYSVRKGNNIEGAKRYGIFISEKEDITTTTKKRNLDSPIEYDCVKHLWNNSKKTPQTLSCLNVKTADESISVTLTFFQQIRKQAQRGHKANKWQTSLDGLEIESVHYSRSRRCDIGYRTKKHRWISAALVHLAGSPTQSKCYEVLRYKSNMEPNGSSKVRAFISVPVKRWGWGGWGQGARVHRRGRFRGEAHSSGPSSRAQGRRRRLEPMRGSRAVRGSVASSEMFVGGAWVAQSVKRPTSARSRSRGPGVRAPRQALGWWLGAWSLFPILCLPLSLPLPRSCSVSLCPKNKINVEKKIKKRNVCGSV